MTRSRRKRPIRGPKPRKRRRTRATPHAIKQAEFVAREAGEPHEKAPRREPAEYIGRVIHRAWTDDGGVAHHAMYAYDSWTVVCDTPDFLRKVRAVGSNKLRISSDMVNCLWCILRQMR